MAGILRRRPRLRRGCGSLSHPSYRSGRESPAGEQRFEPSLDQRINAGTTTTSRRCRDHAADDGDRQRLVGFGAGAETERGGEEARMTVAGSSAPDACMRIGQASASAASSTDRLPLRRWLVRSTSRMEFLATRPISR